MHVNIFFANAEANVFIRLSVFHVHSRVFIYQYRSRDASLYRCKLRSTGTSPHATILTPCSGLTSVVLMRLKAQKRITVAVATGLS